MTIEKLKEIVTKSLRKLCEEDFILIDSVVKEESINHKFAQYIEEHTKCIFPELLDIDIDIEYEKYKVAPKKMMDQTPIRPDILVHKRQSGNTDNYLVIEAKKGYSTKHDRNKIEYLVSNNKYNYLLGCLVSYQPNKEYLIVQFWQKSCSSWDKYKFKKQPFSKIE